MGRKLGERDRFYFVRSLKGANIRDHEVIARMRRKQGKEEGQPLTRQMSASLSSRSHVKQKKRGICGHTILTSPLSRMKDASCLDLALLSLLP